MKSDITRLAHWTLFFIFSLFYSFVLAHYASITVAYCRTKWQRYIEIWLYCKTSLDVSPTFHLLKAFPCKLHHAFLWEAFLTSPVSTKNIKPVCMPRRKVSRCSMHATIYISLFYINWLLWCTLPEILSFLLKRFCHWLMSFFFISNFII